MQSQFQLREAAREGAVFGQGVAVAARVVGHLLQSLQLTRGAAQLSHQYALVREQQLAVAPAVTFLADQVLARHPHLVEEDFVDVRVAVHRADRPYRNARRLHVDQQERDALLRPIFRTGAHQAEYPVRPLHVGGPDLLAGDQVIVALAYGARAQVGKVGTCAGF